MKMPTSGFLLIQCGDTQELDFLGNVCHFKNLHFKTHTLTIMKWVIYKLYLNKH